jgi:hypothetical protein
MQALLLFALLAAPPSQFFTLETSYEPPKGGREAAVVVAFRSADPEVHVNADPAPRLKLEAGQKVLVDRQPPAEKPKPVTDPAFSRYLEDGRARFAVAPVAGLAKGPHLVNAAVSYYYCSKREGWCRKGTQDVEISVP